MAIVIADTMGARTRRVWSVVYAARRLADPHDPLGREVRHRLPATSRLSQPGVELALRRHLEVSPTRKQIAQLVASAGRAPEVWVLLAANVCTAPLRALAWAAATAPLIRLRPSSRDPVVAELLARVLTGCHDFARAGGRLSLVDQLAPRAGDELHLYGNDETLQHFAPLADSGVTVRAHGTGLGVAVVSLELAPPRAARLLAEDIVPFDQRGCLSPRFALVEGGADRAREVARALDRALTHLGRTVPRGPLEPADREAAARFRTLAEALGGYYGSTTHGVGLDVRPRALLLPPALRCIWVVPCDAKAAERLLAPWLRFVVSIGGVAQPRAGSVGARVAELLPRARHTALGTMQTPPLDGPVDRRADR